jgi:DNA modification methylase
MSIPIHCAYDDLVDIDTLTRHPKNRNKHPKAQIDRLAKIIKYQGIRSPIKISKQSGFITAGHGRLEAFKRLKIKEVPINVQDYESEEQEYADLQSDNAVALWAQLDLSGINADVPDLGPDFDIDLLGIKDFVLEPAEKFEAQCGEDEVPEVKESFVKPGDIWLLGDHRLMCGDSTSIDAVEKLMAGAAIHLMFTDPPYGINVVNVGASSKMGFVGAQNAPGQRARARAYKPIIGDDKEFDPGHLFAIDCQTRIMWGANYYASKLPDQPQWLVWDKKTQDGGLDHNNFSDCELAWTDAKGKAVKVYRHVWAGMLRHGSRKEEMTERVHPTQKPVGLCEQIISDFSKTNECIIDLYGGSGSTLIACEKTNRKCFMMEIDPHYCGVIIERWQKYTGKKAELANGKTVNSN